MSYVFPLIIICGWLLLIISTSLLSKRFLPEEKELSRKIVHIGSGPILIVAYLYQLPYDLIFPLSCIITFTLFINNRLNLIRSLENIDRKSFGTTAYWLSTSILLFFFWSNNPSAVIAGILMMALGDGFAGLIGRKINSPSWKILDQKKSLVGTLVMFITGFIILLSINQLMNTAYLSTLDIFIITSIAVLLEQLSFYGIDNLTVPIAVALIWNWLL